MRPLACPPFYALFGASSVWRVCGLCPPSRATPLWFPRVSPVLPWSQPWLSTPLQLHVPPCPNQRSINNNGCKTERDNRYGAPTWTHTNLATLLPQRTGTFCTNRVLTGSYGAAPKPPSDQSPSLSILCLSVCLSARDASKELCHAQRPRGRHA